jgi:hypothetical protein
METVGQLHAPAALYMRLDDRQTWSKRYEVKYFDPTGTRTPTSHIPKKNYVEVFPGIETNQTGLAALR